MEECGVGVCGTEEEGVVDKGVVAAEGLAVTQGFKGGGLRHDIGHVEDGGHASGCCCAGLCGEVAFVGEARLAGVDVGVDDAGEEEDCPGGGTAGRTYG